MDKIVHNGLLVPIGKILNSELDFIKLDTINTYYSTDEIYYIIDVTWNIEYVIEDKKFDIDVVEVWKPTTIFKIALSAEKNNLFRLKGFCQNDKCLLYSNIKCKKDRRKLKRLIN
ncbi:MAG: hypothetical protein GXO89_13540 [Chlorobi bacterium]|nr:hypothetical protein [Chlorobiota bacterium]